MNSKQYKEYLQTPHWKKFREKVLAFWEYRCALCYSRQDVQVHHRTYVRLGKEKLTDCLPLCDSCHSLHTNFAGNFLPRVFGEIYNTIRGVEKT